MNSYHEYMFMKSDSWIQMGYNEFLYLNSHAYEFIWEFIYSFHIWIHIHMNSYNDYMNSYVYEFTYMNSHMNSSWYQGWNHMIFSYMSSYVSWIHIWIRVYQGSRWNSLITCCSSFISSTLNSHITRAPYPFWGWQAPVTVQALLPSLSLRVSPLLPQAVSYRST